MPEIQRGQQLWDVLLAAAWTLKELKLENNLGFMKSPKLLHFCRTNVCLYSPQGSRAVWCLGWISWEGYLHWVHFLPPTRSWASSLRSRVLLAGSSMAASVPREHRQHSHSGIKVPPTPSSSWAGSDRNHPLKIPSPHRPLLSAPNTLCIMLQISFKENKFCISSTGQAIQGLQKVSRAWIGKHSQNQQADGLSFWFTSPPFYDCLACSASIYSQQTLWPHYKGFLWLSMWSTVNKFIKISGTKKIFFDATPPP